MSENIPGAETSQDSEIVTPPKPKKWRRWVSRIFLALKILAIYPLYLAANWWFLPSIPDITIDNIASVEIKFFIKSNSKPNKFQLKSEDQDKIKDLLDTITNATRSSDHKCASSGSVIFHLKNEESVKLSILPGHDEQYYEYRYDSRINKVNRQEFLSALKALGVNKIVLVPIARKFDSL